MIKLNEIIKSILAIIVTAVICAIIIAVSFSLFSKKVVLQNKSIFLSLNINKENIFNKK
jgi:hypothetical protein